MQNRTTSSVNRYSATDGRPTDRRHAAHRRAALSAKRLSEEIGGAQAPCFYFAVCRGTQAVSKGGRGVCRACADKMSGVEYPLTGPLPGELRRIDYSLKFTSAVPCV
jgi:hypothetical protein